MNSRILLTQATQSLRTSLFDLRQLAVCLIAFLFFSSFALKSYGQNPILLENAKPGNPASEWDLINGIGDLTIQGFSTEMSVNKGEIVKFKIRTNAIRYVINIYRLGYYQGNGARLIDTAQVTANLPQIQPEDLYDLTTGKTDCSNWGESGQWNVPLNAVSGLYIAKLTRSDNGGSSHIFFVVRDDSGISNLLFKTSDATWQAYNDYGGNSFYVNNSGIPIPGSTNATKLSYNRPFFIRYGTNDYHSPFNAEYPMIRWLERNGYDVSYTTDADMNRDPTPITPSIHKVVMSVGHDEYWAQATRTKFENARNAGVHLAFFSGNEMYWRTRWEDDSRTLVCYKEGTDGDYVCGGKCDPIANEWTGLWRSGCDLNLANACQPENALSGQMSWIQVDGSISVPDTYKNLRFWRNTSVANLLSGQTATFSNGTLGYEWDYEQAFSTYPSGRITMSSTTLGGQTHKLSLYRHSSGALVFGAGSIQWSWGLDGVHDRGGSVEDGRMQQATVNLFADMGVQPASLQTDLVPAVASTDVVPPQSTINPLTITTFGKGNLATIKGSASDVGGVVAGVEISFDGGITWQMAKGNTNWSFDWIPSAMGQYVIKTRAFDDIGNIENTATASKLINVTVGASVCPCYIFNENEIPYNPNVNDGKAIEVGVKFRTSEDGVITGLRFYKGQGASGTHLGHLWTSQGTLLSEATFVNETASGWQQVSFSTPVAVQAGITYVASMFSSLGYFPLTNPYFDAAVTRGPLTLLANGTDGPNGIYKYSSTTAFPTDNYLSSNYWVDVVFDRPVNFSITNQPASVAVCAGSTATFAVQVSNSANTQYKWQSTTNDITWTDIAGATSAQLSFIATTQDDNYKYRVLVTNNSTTLTSSSALLTVNQVIASVFSKTNASCIGGSITMTQSGGTAPYSYGINGGPAQSSGTFTNLVQGTYEVVVTDSKGCKATVSNIVITQVSSSTVSLVSKTNASCSNNDGSLSVAATNGTSPYQYSIDNVNFQTSGSFTGLAAGTYIVYVKDSKGCTAILTGIAIINFNTLTLQLSTKTNVTCVAKDGTIAVTATGGVIPYTYSINAVTYQTSNIFNGLAAGTYTVTVKDGKGCTANVTDIIIGVNNVLSITLSSKTDATCGLSDGIIGVTGACGVPPYRYLLSTGLYQTSGTFSNLAPGTYTVYLIDSKSTVDKILGIVVAENKTLALKTSAIVGENCAALDGSVTVAASGGKSPYQYKLGSGAYKTSNIFANLGGGSYDVTVKDYNGCTTTITAIVPNIISTLALNVTSRANATCKGSDGSITVNGSGGAGSYTYSLNGGTYQSAGTFNNLTEGTYAVNVKDAKGCTVTVSNISLIRISFIASVDSVTDISCKGKDGSISLTTVGGTAPYTYSLNGSKYDMASNVLFNLKSGTYYVTVKDAYGCISVVRDIAVQTAPTLTANVTSKTNACSNINNGSITTTATGGIAFYQFSLNGGSYQTSNTFSNLAPGTYSVKIKDAKGCLFTVSGIVLTRLTTTCTGRGYVGIVKSSIKSNDLTVEKANEASSNISLFPNPSTGNFKLNVKGLNGNTANIVVVDALGNEVYKVQVAVRSDVQIVPISLNQIHKGIYFVKLSTNKLATSEKLIVY